MRPVQINEDEYEDYIMLPDGISFSKSNGLKMSSENISNALVIDPNQFSTETMMFEDGKLNTSLYDIGRLPDGLDYKNGVFTVENDKITNNGGLNIKNILEIDTTETKGSLCLEKPGATYKVKLLGGESYAKVVINTDKLTQIKGD